MRRYTALSAILFLFVIFLVQHEYRFHNKYTIASQQNTAFLLKGMLYPDVLLSPKEVKQHTGIPVLTGSYQNLSVFHEDESGFGKATMVFTYTTDKPGDNNYIYRSCSVQQSCISMENRLRKVAALSRIRNRYRIFSSPFRRSGKTPFLFKVKTVPITIPVCSILPFWAMRIL